MALNSNLLISWNFDKVTGSNTSGEFDVVDISNNYSGFASGFSSSTVDFIKKEEIKLEKRVNFESLEGEDTIQIVDDEDERITSHKKPNSIRLMVENSMYQIINDEMLNLFSSVNKYALAFSAPSNKYKTIYTGLQKLREDFFENTLDKPDLEKYIEFYKWLDSSLGTLIDQLKPENSSNIKGLKNTVESHLLERSKVVYPIPLTFQDQKVFSNSVLTVITNTTASAKSKNEGYYESRGIDVLNESNIKNKNFIKNYEVAQTAGKFVNNRGNKENKTVLRTNFSSGDGLSENNRATLSEEYSVYNDTNQRARAVRDIFNVSESVTSSNSDNKFVQYNIPYTSSNYVNTGAIFSEAIFGEKYLFNRRNNLFDDFKSFPIRSASGARRITRELEFAIVEPPVEFSVPTKQKIRVKGAFEDITVYSPYESSFKTFSSNLLNSGIKLYFDRDLFSFSDEETFYNKSKILATSGNIEIKSLENIDYIYPPKHFFGLAESRKKLNYEEEEGVFTDSGSWTNNSYNLNSALIRTFWRDNEESRHRTRGLDTANGTGSLNNLNYYNISQSAFLSIKTGSAPPSPTAAQLSASWYQISGSGAGTVTHQWIYIDTKIGNNYFDSLHATSGKIFSSFVTHSSEYGFDIFLSTGSNNQLGDLSPLPHSEKIKFHRKAKEAATSLFQDYERRPKAEFIFNNFPEPVISGTNIFLGQNQSYQNGIPENLRPFYDSYEDFFENIRPRSVNYSIIPEYKVSNFIDKDASTNSYFNFLSMRGNNSLNDYSVEYATNFNNFVVKDTNKIKIVVNGIKKLLPYNGFYPSQRASQIVNYFSQSYFSGTSTPVTGVATVLQPFFAPGILFNTIKSGIAVDFPTVVQDVENDGTIYELDNSTNTNLRTLVAVETSSLKKIPFEAILAPESLSGSGNILRYIDPTALSSVLSPANIVSGYFIYPAFSSSLLQEKNTLYKKAINNYLAEIPNFFLKNNTLTYLETVPEKSFNVVTTGSTYKMRVILEKDNSFSMFYSNGNPYSLPEGSLFGPPVDLSLNSNSSLSAACYNPLAYYPYTPAYMRQETTGGLNSVIISYTPSQNGVPTIDDILENIVIENPIDSNPGYQTKPAVSASMTLGASLNFKFKKREFSTTFNSDGSPIVNTLDTARWQIKTLFETPLINYKNLQTINYDSSSCPVNARSSNSGTQTYAYTASSTEYNGIWNAYGEIPAENSSVKIKLSDSEFQNSLLKVVKFTETTKTIGTLAEEKSIKEAVVIIPFVDATNANANDINLSNPTYGIGGKFFLLNENTINSLLKTTNYKNLTLRQIKNKLETDSSINKNNSIIQLMTKMVNYNLPKHLNWLDNRNSGLKPFVMYIAEFEHVLDKQELADIWQGTMPEISRFPEDQSITLEHFLGPNELFGNIDLTAYSFKFRVFKAKSRANTNYQNDLFNTEPSNTINEDNSTWYSYNWPYDYFSLIELVNIQAGGVFEQKTFQLPEFSELPTTTLIPNFSDPNDLLASALRDATRRIRNPFTGSGS